MPDMKRYLVKMTKTMEVTAESHEAATAYARVIFNNADMPEEIRRKVWGSSPVTIRQIESEVIN